MPNLLQIDMKPSKLIVHLCKIVQQCGPTNTKQSEKLAVKFDRLWGLQDRWGGGWVGEGTGLKG